MDPIITRIEMLPYSIEKDGIRYSLIISRYSIPKLGYRVSYDMSPYEWKDLCEKEHVTIVRTLIDPITSTDLGVALQVMLAVLVAQKLV
jgi:hypothetical protein